MGINGLVAGLVAGVGCTDGCGAGRFGRVAVSLNAETREEGERGDGGLGEGAHWGEGEGVD